MQPLKDRLVEYGKSLGLDLIGVAGAEPFRREEERLIRRRDAGLGPNPFEPQEIGPRVYPEELLPGVKSIIAAGISYLMDDPAAESEPGNPTGWLSMYCRGLDYHQLLRQKLNDLAAWLEAERPGCKTKVYVDTGPPLDRAVAERAGIGKYGKNSTLITPGFGTWVFLGEILTDVELEPNQTLETACGSCTLCIDACPTQAITEWQIDANRCLSYVTQMKGIIPAEYREVMGNRLFGCDDCQTVCPFNKKAKSGIHPEFAPVAELGAHPNLLQMMAMTKSDFRRVFEPTAAGWRGKTTIQRNTLVALGNSGDPAALPALRDALKSESPVLRVHAAWGLGRLASLTPDTAPDARVALTERQAIETDPEVRAEIETALQGLP